MLNRMITLDAPIKINLALHVVGQNSQGYHLLETLVTFVPTGDKVSVAASSQDSVQIEGDYGRDLSTGRDNLIVKARDLLRQTIGQAAFPVALSLIKRIPVASGLGGGSANAAATLLALSQIWRQGKERLINLSAQIGADVPMCLHALQHNQALLAKNIGDQITPLPFFPALDMVIVNPNKALSTKAVFDALVEKNNPPLYMTPEQFPKSVKRFSGKNCGKNKGLERITEPSEVKTALEALICRNKVLEALQNMRNDLYKPAYHLMPELGKIIEALQQTGAICTRMSGSGASCFALYDNQIQAQQAALAFKEQNPDYFVQAVQTVGGK